MNHHQWVRIEVTGEFELVNLALAERLYVNEEGMTCIEFPDGIVETETSLTSIARSSLGITIPPIT